MYVGFGGDGSVPYVLGFGGGLDGGGPSVGFGFEVVLGSHHGTSLTTGVGCGGHAALCHGGFG